MATSYATALFLDVDSSIQQLRKLMDVDWDRDFGPEHMGYKLTAIIRATTAQIRHAHNWDNSLPQDDGGVLKGIGIKDITKSTVPSEVLRIIGRDHYFAFEDDVQAALLEMLDELTAVSNQSLDGLAKALVDNAGAAQGH